MSDADVLAAEAEKRYYLEHHVEKSTILHSFHAREGQYWDCVDMLRALEWAS
jgi:hypothetical protein